MVYVSQAFYLLVNESFEGLDIVATRRDEQLIEIKIPPNRAKALISCYGLQNSCGADIMSTLTLSNNSSNEGH